MLEIYTYICIYIKYIIYYVRSCKLRVTPICVLYLWRLSWVTGILHVFTFPTAPGVRTPHLCHCTCMSRSPRCGPGLRCAPRCAGGGPGFSVLQDGSSEPRRPASSAAQARGGRASSRPRWGGGGAQGAPWDASPRAGSRDPRSCDSRWPRAANCCLEKLHQAAPREGSWRRAPRRPASHFVPRPRRKQRLVILFCTFVVPGVFE